MPPVNDLGFVDVETVIIGRGKAGRRSDRAVDVEHGAAVSADEVMMIVTHAILVAGRRSGRLDPADEVLVGQDAESVVHRLAGDRTNDQPNIAGQLVGGGVRAVRHRSHDGEPLSGHLHPVLAQ